ncbi:MAG TPA: hypothetical protein VM911_01945 [Pyrinomonadaceae bacterium]|nr:hypothetical protein [Pyrinomonadaceae bacterium]
MFDQIQSFPCPNCRELINDRMERCKYCDTPIDKGIAQLAAETQRKVNQAYSDASYTKTAAVTMWVFLGLSFIPFLPFVGWGFLITFIVVLVMLIRWQVMFSGLITNDPDYEKARRTKNLSLILWIVALPTGFIIQPLVGLFLQRLSN